jgi:lipid-binding SYLF domain-containing protein
MAGLSSPAIEEDEVVKRFQQALLIAASTAVMQFVPGVAHADTPGRMAAAVETLHDLSKAPDSEIPADLLKKAECIVVVPSLKSGAFIVGADYGRGFAACRTANGWSAPAAVKMEAGSVGFQIGGSETEVVMLVMNKKGMERLLSSKFTLGGDATVAAGPVGRNAQAKTDATMRAEILSYSRSRGVFAGIALEGGTLREDDSANKDLYGKEMTNRAILSGGVPAPESAASFATALKTF